VAYIHEVIGVVQCTRTIFNSAGRWVCLITVGNLYEKEVKMKLNRIAPLIFTIAVLMIAGCQSTGVIPMDQDSYMIGKKDGSPGIGESLSNKADVYREANAFCREKGLEVKTLHVTTTPAMPLRLGSTELHFRCVSPGGAAQPLIKESDTTIDIRNR